MSVRASSSSRPSRTIPTTGGSPSRSGVASSSSTAQAALGSSASGSAPPPTRATVSSTSPSTSAGEALGPRAHLGQGLVEHPQDGDLAACPLGIREERERPLERRERELVGPQRPLQRMPTQPLDEVGPADDDPGLRPAEQLVAREADEIGARGEARRGGRLVAQLVERARAEIVDEREAGPLRDPRQILRRTPPP